MENTTLGHFLRQERQRHHISRPVLAQETGIPERALEDYELNRRAPSYSACHLIARFLEIDEDELLDRAGYTRPNQEHNGRRRFPGVRTHDPHVL